MSLALKTNVKGYQPGDIRNVVSYALKSAASQAHQRYEYYADICTRFEQQYAMTSDEFVMNFDSGRLGDDQEYFDWYAAKRGLDIWYKRLEILSGISV